MSLKVKKLRSMMEGRAQTSKTLTSLRDEMREIFFQVKSEKDNFNVWSSSSLFQLDIKSFELEIVFIFIFSPLAFQTVTLITRHTSFGTENSWLVACSCKGKVQQQKNFSFLLLISLSCFFLLWFLIRFSSSNGTEQQTARKREIK